MEPGHALNEREEPVRPNSLCASPAISRRIDPTKPRTSTLKPDGFKINNGRVDIGQTPLVFSG
jgi:hypothetical protein